MAGVIRELKLSDTAEALLLLGARPLHNVFLEHVVRSGALGRTPGFLGYDHDGRLEAIMMVGPLGGTALDVRNDEAYPGLAREASRLSLRPRHIVGSEDVTVPFWSSYERFAPRVIWTRREPVYVVRGAQLQAQPAPDGRLEVASERDLEAVLENSAEQHREDLKDDRHGADPEGFRDRHRIELRVGRWWVLRERGRIVFQAHVGAESSHVVQIGGVFTPPDLRNRGYATRGVRALVSILLARRPAVSLFCDEKNAPARRVYENLGFRALMHYRSWLLDSPSEGSCAPEGP